MAVRVRADGTIVCAAMFPARPDDRAYLDDGLHERLSSNGLGVLVSEPHEKHRLDGLWWWYDQVPEGRSPSPIYEKARSRLHKGWLTP